ncbi:MAG: PAS domain-containing protein [Acidovorax sp.]|nr:PAS domain-containing protein [Acidovorax sp.]
MRANLPVTAREYPFPPGQSLVSITDLQGRITYCNPAFVEVSGFTREELLGQPHNIVRHPDMPEEAFRDLWDTIANGSPWAAPVKNRRKNGDYYWVLANATPLMEDGRLTGFMSVRIQAAREQIDAAERLYAIMQEEQQRGQLTHRLRRSNVIAQTLAGRLGRALRLGMRTRLVLLSLMVLGTAFAAATVGGQTLTLPAILAWLGATALTIGAAFHMHHLTVRPMEKMARLANQVAGCDLTVDVAGAMGAMEKALTQICVNLGAVVRDARDQSRETQQAVTEVASGNLDLSSRTEAQASNLEQTAASMEQITGSVKLATESASQAAQLAQQAAGIAQASNEAVDGVAQAMQKIRASSGRIGEITQLIDSIAFQTNILALNATVEAARAGGQGRGFAVVASEVRSLARRSADAAKEIRHLIEDAVGIVQEGQQKTDTAQKTMAESLALVGRVSAFMGEIHGASNEQLGAIAQVNAAITQLDQLTQHNAALVEEHSAATMALQVQAQTVVDTVQVFRLKADHNRQAPDAVQLRRAMKAQAALMSE